MDEGFSNKEYLVEIRDELRDFKTQYDADVKQRGYDMSKRPTRGELYSLVVGAASLIGLALAFGA